MVLGVKDSLPFRLWYQIWADSNGKVRECLLYAGGESLHLYTDGKGNWIDASDSAYPALAGCLYIDITVTPFTNTLPIRHLGLKPGESGEIPMVYISAPDLDVRLTRQRYTCLSHTDTGGIYRYEGLESGFTADLPVDARGLVLDYPGIWKRVL